MTYTIFQNDDGRTLLRDHEDIVIGEMTYDQSRNRARMVHVRVGSDGRLERGNVGEWFPLSATSSDTKFAEKLAEHLPVTSGFSVREAQGGRK